MTRRLKDPITIEEWLQCAKLICPWCEDGHEVIPSAVGWAHRYLATTATCRAHLMHEQIDKIRRREKFLEDYANASALERREMVL